MEDLKGEIAAELQPGTEETNVEIIEEEAMDIGRVQWSAYKELFDYGFTGGLWIILIISVLINLCTLSVSLYLAFTLANRFKATNSVKSSQDQEA